MMVKAAIPRLPCPDLALPDAERRLRERRNPDAVSPPNRGAAILVRARRRHALARAMWCDDVRPESDGG